MIAFRSESEMVLFVEALLRVRLSIANYRRYTVAFSHSS